MAIRFSGRPEVRLSQDIVMMWCKDQFTDASVLINHFNFVQVNYYCDFSVVKPHRLRKMMFIRKSGVL